VTGSRDTVCALVLTRNRKRLLAACVTSLLAQTHPLQALVVVDNASDDGTAEHLRELGLLGDPRVRYVRSERNTGGAGGFARAMREGLAGDTDWLWLMDDDADPRPDALERLLGSPPAADPGTAVLACTVRGPGGELELLHRGHVGRFMRALPAAAYAGGGHPELDFASFVGFLVRREAAARTGLPRAELFIGCDDVEYSLRVRRHGAIRLVPEAEIVHRLGMGGGAPTRRSAVWNRVLGASYTSPSWDGYWKNLYAIRNFLWIRRAALGPVAFAGTTAAYIVKSLLYDERPLRRIPWIVRFAWAGWRGRLDRAPSPQAWARIAGR
jgi:rhamnopyranosyl-N-acetylglucosaminyl-diphospho-decaprenol beta-1,3/1,4-galactofuranosyltransferase